MASGTKEAMNLCVSSIVLCLIFSLAETKMVDLGGYEDLDLEELEFSYEFVTCGSVIKLLNVGNNVRLHSHDVKYGSGSGQQSVTAVEDANDHNSYWRVTGKTGEQCTRGEPIKCGDTVRLMHINTAKYLHSHHFTSPLSHNLEVSAFGEDGVGDDGDFWVVTCPGKSWRRDEKIRFRHVVTSYYLHISGDTYGRPIHGQKEVSAHSSPNELNYWMAMEGVYIKPTETLYTGHDEL